MSKNSSPFIPFPITLYDFFMMFNATEKALLLYFLKHFHYNNFAKNRDTFTLQEISDGIKKTVKSVPDGLKTLTKFQIIFISKERELVIEFNKKFLNKDYLPIEDIAEKIANEQEKTSDGKNFLPEKTSDSIGKNFLLNRKKLPIEQEKTSDSIGKNFRSDIPETIEKTSISESPNNYINNIYNNNINNSFNKQKTPDGFIDKNKNEVPENPKNLFDELFSIKALSPKEKREREAKIIFNKLKAIDYMKQPERPEDYNDGLINKRISQVDNLEVFSQMIESALRDYSLNTNEERCKRINTYLKYPENFHFIPAIESDDAREKKLNQLQFLKPIIKLFQITGDKPDLIITEFITRLIPLCLDFSKGYIRASDELIIDTIRSREEFFKKMNRPFLADDKARIRQDIESDFEKERQRFELISFTIKKSYSVSDLKSLINYSLYSNKHRQKVKDFINADLEKATFRILKAVTGAADNFSPETQEPEPAPKEKIMTFEEVRHKKSFNKNTLPAFIPHIENNEGLADYVAENLKKGV